MSKLLAVLIAGLFSTSAAIAAQDMKGEPTKADTAKSAPADAKKTAKSDKATTKKADKKDKN